MYDHKIAIVLSRDLLDWQKLNVTAFLASAIAIQFPETHGQPLVSASGTQFLPFLKHPILVYGADSAAEVRKAFERAQERGVHLGVYPRPLFATKNEEENVHVLAQQTDQELDLVGIILYGENKLVDKALKGLKFHP
ncbi:DUF2000 domain-containing protein [Hymenobacter sp. GOD-10R]|uniref:DUF2000 domain-containing protein n=1 Tax=Hymenobacter sp. GOD-10R TaxID=3093922 RepID=UPI002D791FC7|nr:DUF2000 domain-containing protein [Hymenobacter sp. GOD-10R]WRQ30570.1 DUF2000 domain-containing protein [Hymenobacter sp. GOD-10R]